MIVFFQTNDSKIIAVDTANSFDSKTIEKLEWLLNGSALSEDKVEGTYLGPRKEMITPWSTNAMEITQNMGINNITRIEEFVEANDNTSFDPMLQAKWNGLDQSTFTIDIEPQKVVYIDDVDKYNKEEGLALNDDEVKYLNGLSVKLDRKLTDSEVFGFSQINSEHCRHKIFNGTFIIDGKEKESSLFNLIRKTSKVNPNKIVSAYKDNVSFVKGPKAMQFSPATQNKSDFFETKEIDTVMSLKAETHNFPTTVEPFNGAATGAGGEIRDRMAGGQGSVPMAGTAVYMTSYSRLENGRGWEKAMDERQWLYQSPIDILIKASNGASDFGNKFGQPLINGSVFTFEHTENGKKFGFDKVIMLAGGIGYGKHEDSLKEKPQKGDKIVILGGDNYRIGMGGSAVSSVATGEFNNSIELNAIQRSNPEMQKRACNAIRAFAESTNNPIISIHDHGAGGHLNCLSELVEETGGVIDLNMLPVGDPTLSAKEIVGNESQERMGLVIKEEDISLLQEIADRERAPMYVVGSITGDHIFKFEDTKTGQHPINLEIEDMFGNPPKTILKDEAIDEKFNAIDYNQEDIEKYLNDVLQLEAVGCKDWLTNKVDRSVTGKVAQQQCVGDIQLPLSDLGAVAIDFKGGKGIATSLGHASIPALIDPVKGSVLSIAESLTNLVWAPLEDNLNAVSLSANWMWPSKNKGEDARLYDAVESISDFACALGINIPTGKDSLSMVQKYPNGDKVFSPGTVIISASGEVENIKQIVTPNLTDNDYSTLIYIDFSKDSLKLGGSSFAQTRNKLGTDTPTVKDFDYFKNVFNAIQTLIKEDKVLAGHDISAGGLITTVLEMAFPTKNIGLSLNFDKIDESDLVKILFSENPGVVLQVKNISTTEETLNSLGIQFIEIGKLSKDYDKKVTIQHNETNLSFDIPTLRDTWYKTSFLLDSKQTVPSLAKARYENYSDQSLSFKFPEGFKGNLNYYGLNFSREEKSTIKAAIIREKGVNGDREMAYSMYLAGFDVKDIHMTDLINGKEDLSDVNFIVYVGGFSNSDVLGSAKGWAGAFIYNEKAKQALDNFYAREDTLSLGVCNGCQLMQELGLIHNDPAKRPSMIHNDSHKFESAYLNVDILENNSILLKSLSGSKLGIWVAHGEGKFNLPANEENYNIAMKYSYDTYPGNPNGSDYNTAALVSDNGRHLAMMPHLERVIFPWQCAHYPELKKNNDITPWILPFIEAKKWIEEKVN